MAHLNDIGLSSTVAKKKDWTESPCQPLPHRPCDYFFEGVDLLSHPMLVLTAVTAKMPSNAASTIFFTIRSFHREVDRRKTMPDTPRRQASCTLFNRDLNWLTSFQDSRLAAC